VETVEWRIKHGTAAPEKPEYKLRRGGGTLKQNGDVDESKGIDPKRKTEISSETTWIVSPNPFPDHFFCFLFT
jgi:hypothetical protein